MIDFFVVMFEFIGGVFKMFFDLPFSGRITYGHIFIFLLILSLIIAFIVNRKGNDD